jgi:hypothetical protein
MLLTCQANSLPIEWWPCHYQMSRLLIAALGPHAAAAAAAALTVTASCGTALRSALRLQLLLQRQPAVLPGTARQKMTHMYCINDFKDNAELV